MTKETRRDPREKFVPRSLPWLLAMLMLGVYCLTLNHWVSMFNLDYVARLSGWTWQPELFNPLILLVTCPLRVLPTGQIPVALNLLSAVCAALTLGLLARSVALLPQDRTEAQRLREHSDFSFLTTRTAWLPPVLAVLVCGLQFTFWEHATNFTGETVDLLVFAFVVWELLEYRLDEREGRLMLALVLYGADMSENVAMIGFLPLLLAALIWIRGLSFFNSGFLMRLVLCGLAGASLYLLLPTLTVVFGHTPADLWWQALKFNLSSQSQMVKYFLTDTGCRHDLYLISLTTLLPVLMLAFRWSAGFGDRSRIGTAMTGLAINVVFGMILLICVWGAFDPPFSARQLGSGLQFPVFFLTLYYLAALSVGYYSGYFLLISRALVSKRRRQRVSPGLMALNPVVIVAVATLAVLATAGLICKNGPVIRSINSGILKKYAGLMAASLPRTGGILLSDSENSRADIPRRLYFLQEALWQAGREKEYVPVDTRALNNPDYHRYLHRRYPEKWPLVVDKKTRYLLNPRGLLGLIELLSKTNAIYYLHPSFGYYFEVFYQEPHGLVYQLKPLPEDTLRPRLPDNRLMAENEAFWTRAESEDFGPIIQEVTPRDSFARPHGFAQKTMAWLHVTQEPNLNAQLAGMYYSRSLDFWGVQAQRAHELTQAAAVFETAQKLNPDNQVAAINLAFNRDLQAGRTTLVDLSKTTADQFAKYRSWQEIVTVNGPFDEPSFCFQDGNTYLQGSLLNQAINSFARVHELAPDYLPALLALGEVYVFAHRPDLALETLKEPMANPGKFSLNDTNSTELNIIAAAAYLQKTNVTRGVSLMEREISHHPDDNDLLTTAAHVYLTQGLFTNALHVFKLKLETDPDDPSWLFGLGYTYMRLGDSGRAIAALTRVISLQTNNYDALFNRAVALLNTGRLQAAREDYLQIQKAYPKSFKVAYGLGDIAWRQQATNEAIQNYGVYVANAPTNTAEFRLIRQRLADLKGPAR